MTQPFGQPLGAGEQQGLPIAVPVLPTGDTRHVTNSTAPGAASST